MAPPTAASLKEQGNAAYATGDLLEALTLISSASSLDPTSPIFLSNASATLFELGRYTEALELTEKALTLEERANSRSPALAGKLRVRKVKVLLQLKDFAAVVRETEAGAGELTAELTGLRETAKALLELPQVLLEVAKEDVLSLPFSKPTHSATMNFYAL